jgi:hypothetical protein
VCDVSSRRVRATIFALEKQLSITYFEFEFVALGIHHTMRKRHTDCHLWLAPLYNIFPQDLTNGTIFEEKKSY